MLQEKFEKLKDILKGMGQAAIAYSGGVDSNFLLKCAADVLGAEHVIAVTVLSDFIPKQEQEDARSYAQEIGVRQVRFYAEVLEIPGVAQNPSNRCYYCKKAIFTRVREEAEKEGISVVAEGSNMDDMRDYRPGMKAIEELGVRSPLKEAGLTKEEIRALSKQLGLSTWNKPSKACLASRFAYGEMITKERLKMIEQAEDYLNQFGFSQIRVRLHQNLARIELGEEDMKRVFQEDQYQLIAWKLKELGFTYVTMDLSGFHSGSMNAGIADSGCLKKSI